MVDLVVVCSVTLQDCYEVSLKESLKKIGIDYLLILSNPNLTLSQSYNSILETNLEAIKNSKYIIFLGQDVVFYTEDWGKKIVEFCNVLPDLGCAGFECRTHDCIAVGYEGNSPPSPVIVNSCDGSECIIPSKLFLERQFDTQFPWYPMIEDYACWVQFVKKLHVYYLPIVIHSGIHCNKPSKWVSRFANVTEYANWLRAEHNRLLKKWNIQRFPTTSWRNGTA